jgi:hypothetical protein
MEKEHLEDREAGPMDQDQWDLIWIPWTRLSVKEVFSSTN